MAAILGVAVVALAWLIILGRWQSRKLDETRRELEETLAPVVERLDRWQKANVRNLASQPVIKDLDGYAKLGENRRAWLLILKRVCLLLPTDNADPRSLDRKLWLVELKLDFEGDIVRGVSWWGIHARGKPTADYDFADKAVLQELKKAPGFKDAQMIAPGTGSAAQGQRYVNDLSPPAKPVEEGKYMLFPVSFVVVLDELEKGAAPK